MTQARTMTLNELIERLLTIAQLVKVRNLNPGEVEVFVYGEGGRPTVVKVQTDDDGTLFQLRVKLQ